MSSTNENESVTVWNGMHIDKGSLRLVNGGGDAQEVQSIPLDQIAYASH